MNNGKMMWEYRAVFTQTNAGGGNVVVNIAPNERFELLYGMIGNDDYAANRSGGVSMTDSAGNIIGYLLLNATVDNERLIFPIQDMSEDASNDGNFFERKVTLGTDAFLKLNMAALAQNETLTISIRGLIKTTIPTITTTGSTGTVTTTETYNKVT